MRRRRPRRHPAPPRRWCAPGSCEGRTRRARSRERSSDSGTRGNRRHEPEPTLPVQVVPVGAVSEPVPRLGLDVPLATDGFEVFGAQVPIARDQRERTNDDDRSRKEFTGQGSIAALLRTIDEAPVRTARWDSHRDPRLLRRRKRWSHLSKTEQTRTRSLRYRLGRARSVVVGHPQEARQRHTSDHALRQERGPSGSGTTEERRLAARDLQQRQFLEHRDRRHRRHPDLQRRRRADARLYRGRGREHHHARRHFGPARRWWRAPPRSAWSSARISRQDSKRWCSRPRAGSRTSTS